MSDIRLAVCHLDEAARAAVAVRLRGATVQTDAADGCDAVLIALPAGDVVEGYILGGVDTLWASEAPPPRDVIERLAAAARQRSVQFVVVNPDRYLQSRQLIRKQLGGPLGEPGLIRIHRWEPPNTSASAALPDPLIRDIDTALWLAGWGPDRVFAIEPKSGAGRIVQVHLGFPGGAMALLDYTNALPPGDGYSSLSVIAASGAAYADDQQNAQLLYRGGNAQALRTEGRAGQFAAVAQDFVNALAEGRDFSAGVAEWKRVFAVADAVTKSLATGRAVVPEAQT